MTFSLDTLAGRLEQRIHNHRLFDTGVDWDHEIIHPNYGGLSLRNIPHTVADMLGVQLPDHTPLDDAVWHGDKPQAQRVVVVLLDGMGYRQLQEASTLDPMIHDAIEDLTDGRGFTPLTSTAPSTTAVALTTLWTGAVPATTGLMGTSLFLREYSTQTVMLFFKPTGSTLPHESMRAWGMEPGDTIPARGLAEYLTDADVKSYAVIDRRMASSGLSLILHRGLTDFRPHKSVADHALTIRKTLQETRGQRAYINVYWPAIDTMAHDHGVHSEEVRAEIRSQLTNLSNILRDESVKDGQTLVIITADHGHYDTRHLIDLSSDPQALPIKQAMRYSVSGDERLAYLTLTRSGYDAALEALQTHYRDSCAVIESQTALDAGLFGTTTPHPETPYRIGDLILIPRRTYKIKDAYRPPFPFVSVHAGLSDWEMLTPFMWKVV